MEVPAWERMLSFVKRIISLAMSTSRIRLSAAVVLVLWLLRALWATVTGRPVQPWVFKMSRRPPWQRGAGRSRQFRHITVSGDIAFGNSGDDLPDALGK